LHPWYIAWFQHPFGYYLLMTIKFLPWEW